MKSAPQDDRALARLTRRALFVTPTPTRLEALASAVPAEGAPFRVLADRLEPHGILGLVLRNLESIGETPGGPDADHVRARREALVADDRRARLTVTRLLDNTGDLDVVLLKGASLALDVYPELGLRAAGDVDVLIDPADLGAARRAGEAAGLVMAETQLPVWWYRLTHFHLKLHPATALLKPVELHWHLHAAALLHTVDAATLRRGARPVDVGGRRALTLDPVDRLLHVATHLESHAGAGAVPSGDAVGAILAQRPPAVRLKWLVDVAACVTEVASATEPEQVAARARDWSAEAAVAHALALVTGDELVEGDASSWSREVYAALAGAHSPARAPRSGERASDVLDFRIGSLALLPRWLFPPGAWLERRYRRSLPTLALRAVHFVRVASRVALAAALLPVALLGRALARRRRRAQREAAFDPEAAFDLVGEWRRASRPPRRGDDG